MAETKNPQNLANLDYDAMHELLSTVISGMQETATAVQSLIGQLSAAKKSSSVGEQWALTYGETLNKAEAAKMLGVSKNHLVKLVSEGGIKQTPDGRIVVRSAAEWANSVSVKSRGKKYQV